MSHDELFPELERIELTYDERERLANEHYARHYDVLVDYPFVTQRPRRLNDHDPHDQAARRCRFCRRGHLDVTFEQKAHAVPEMLGNKSIYSMNECDECNALLAEEYENHLGQWSQFARTASQIKGKGGNPTFKNPDDGVVIASGSKGLKIDLSQITMPPDFWTRPDPQQFTIPTEIVSAPYVPLRAAKALVKIACSVCPTAELAECAPAIDWLMGRNGMSVRPFLLFHGFTPGPLNEQAGRVVLLRRKSESLEPYLWCVVQSAGHRYQILVPGCPADRWLFARQPATFTAWHYRFPEFGPGWSFGETEFGRLDWSSPKAEQATFTAVWNVVRAERLQSNEPPSN